MEYELHPYDAAGHELPVVSVIVMTTSAALARAGRMAKRNGAPVDVARAGLGGWAERYVTTAEPSEWTASGFAFSRLD